ncbi:MAG: tetratricopeptide repeat protein [Rudaea sp.]|nr:tetratricopeptide repeat protein [Rudaea sp.]
MRSRTILPLAAIAIMCLVGLIYWPVYHAGFVWVDKIFFYDNAWLRYGDGWKQFVFHNFYDWSEYFRPLVVALFVFQLRIFDVAPGPMHLVSLGLHLASTLLVGLLALNLAAERASTSRPAIFAGIAMLLYGLHPALIEPVVWIACQFELVVTFFMLLGLLLNVWIKHAALRAPAVAACFFLAACAHESAVSFPLLLVLIDWMQTPGRDDRPPVAGLRSLWQRQRIVYVSVAVAGITYLGFRHWGLGFLLHPKGAAFAFSFAHLQSVCFIYLTYWRILVWPMLDLGPLHVVDAQRFAAFSLTSLCIDVATLALLFGGICFAWKRKPLGCLITAVTIALLPVLHILPILDASLYHERYALVPAAMACALLPRILSAIALPRVQLRAVAIAGMTIAVVWLGLAVVNIRTTVPLWADEMKLWLWVLQEHPDSIEAKSHLLSTYMELDDRVRARQMADSLMASGAVCPMCLLNAASLALADDDIARASVALGKLEPMIPRQNQPRLTQGFILATGELRELKHDAQGAEEAYRDAISMEPLDPQAQMNLALLLARQGRTLEARRQLELALSLLAPDQRDARRRVFEQILDGVSHPPDKPMP